MQIKTNLHFHTSDDPEDAIDYDFYEGMDRAASLGFGAMAISCHNKFIDRPEYEKYAEKRGILLIRGIERNVEGKHVVILNPKSDIMNVKTFADLERYKKWHPEIFVLAPHPYFPASYSLNGKFLKNGPIFDAVEQSWFYSKNVNFNNRAEAAAKKLNLPFIATSDTHVLKFMDRAYAVIDAEEKTPAALFKAVREGKFRNATVPSRFWKDMISSFITGETKKWLPRKKNN
jgi:predicted metal-dependent phosphoesterase TrpH